MVRGKRLECPKIIIKVSGEPKYASRGSAWNYIGPVIARVLARTLTSEKKFIKYHNSE